MGREAEIDALLDALEQARSGHGQVVAVVGEPGVGKSRLSWELMHTQGFLILGAAAASYGKTTGFGAVIDLLRTYFQIETRDDARRIREKVTGKALSLDRALEADLAAMLWLLAIPVGDPSGRTVEVVVWPDEVATAKPRFPTRRGKDWGGSSPFRNTAKICAVNAVLIA